MATREWSTPTEWPLTRIPSSARGASAETRDLAQSALEMYGLSSARFALAGYSGNVLYRVYSDEAEPRVRDDGLFEPGQYLLRIHWPGYRDANAIELELEWLSAMRAERDLPVPEPVRTRGGVLLAHIASPGVPEPRCCSLLRWVRGRRIGDRALAKHYSEQGRLMANMHDFSQRWVLPERAQTRQAMSEAHRVLSGTPVAGRAHDQEDSRCDPC